MAPEGKPLILAAVLLALLIFAAALTWGGSVTIWIGLAGIIPPAFTLFFFRDPQRVPPDKSGAVVAPADGKIIEIRTGTYHDKVGEEVNKVSIFMSPFNVHVNRIPSRGIVKKLHYHPGKFLTAFHPKASMENEQQYIEIESPFGTIACVQIAGWLARRVVCHLREGQMVHTGERFGVIRFGSRVDVYVHSNCRLCAVQGQKVRAGETIIGVFHEKK